MGQDLGREKGAMEAEVAGERVPQGREFGPHAAPRQLGQDRGVARAVNESLRLSFGSSSMILSQQR